MSEPIKVGDLVMVVRPACCQNEFQGFPFEVQRIEKRIGSCSICGKEYNALFALTGRPSRPYMAPLFTLIKIDPPKVDISEKRDETVTA